MAEQDEVTALRQKLQETLVRNTKATEEIESVKGTLQDAEHGVDNERLRRELEGIRGRLANIKTLLTPTEK